ncbi:hypothetical protein LguiB_021811 [Lonicera macranthoides]
MARPICTEQISYEEASTKPFIFFPSLSALSIRCRRDVLRSRGAKIVADHLSENND